MDDYKSKLEKLKEMLSPDYDWEAHWDQAGSKDVGDTFRECVHLVGPDETGDWFQCGSFGFDNTAKVLYRALYLLRPKSVDFTDMYKSELFCFCTPDRRFLCQFYLFKYEAAVYCFAPREAIGGQGSAIIAGAPGADNGWFCNDETGSLFFDVVKAALEHAGYPGSDWRY